MQFQYQKGAIKTDRAVVGARSLHRFQYQKGAIKTPVLQRAESASGRHYKRFELECQALEVVDHRFPPNPREVDDYL